MDLDAEEELNHRQSLKAAVHFTVGRTCEEVGSELGLSYNKQVIATLSEVVSRQIEIYTQDLEAFSKHARRTTINMDDVKLLVRRNSHLSAHIKEMAESMEKPGAKGKKGRKKSKKSDAGTSEEPPGQMEEGDNT